MTRRVLLHCDSGLEHGMGHLMRTIAVGESAIDAGWDVRMGGSIDALGLTAAKAALPGIRVDQIPSEGRTAWLHAAVDEFGPDVVHIDSYRFHTTVPGDALVSSMQDGEFGVRHSDLSIDGSLGAMERFCRPEWSRRQLAGPPAAAIRRGVREQRQAIVRVSLVPRILVVVGGTDPNNLTPAVVDALGTDARPFELTVVCRAEQEAAVRKAARSHPITTHRFLHDLPGVARAHEIVLTAAGTSVWDFACLGQPMALICAADNQVAGYDAAVAAGLALGIGSTQASFRERISSVVDLAYDSAARVAQSEHLRTIVDGLGSWRIVSAWEQLGSLSPEEYESEPRLVARPATLDDAGILFDWRNELETRRASHAQGPLSWDAHREWLGATLSDPERLLLVVQHGTESVGTVRWDAARDGWTVSLTMAPAFRGRGWARALLRAGEDALPGGGPTRLKAEIRADNARSLRLFARAGYLPDSPESAEGFVRLAKCRFG